MTASNEAIVPGGIYHIYNRGNNRENLFREERNYPYFLQLMEKHLAPIAEIYAYCLMKNHYHLLIRLRAEEHFPERYLKSPSKPLSNLFNAYAKACNKAYGRTGSLFEEHPRRKRIEDDWFFMNAVKYIHLNPVEHGFVKDVNDYPWSSYPYYRDQKECFLTKEYVLDIFGGLENFIFVHT